MEKKLPQFEATEENIISIVNMLMAYEKSGPKTEAAVIKKYTQYSCGDLAALIKTLVPNSTVVVGLIIKKEELENIPFHFMVKIPSKENPKKEFYFDINGKHNREGLEKYIATILGRDPKTEVGITSRTKQDRKIESSNGIALHCLEDIKTYPTMISCGMFNKGKHK